MNRFFKSLNSVLCILCISIFTSQCFAQSAAASANADALKSRQYLELINSVFEYVRSNYVDEVDPQVLYEGAMKGIMNALGDPYSSYLDTKQMSSLNDTTGGNFGGVGLSISKAAESTPENPAYVLVASPIEDTPGFKAGIQAGDLIISIDGTDTSTLTMDEVLGHLRGVIGESVSLIVRRGKNMEFPVTLVRALIEVPTVKYGMIDKTGYIKIIEFTPQTPERVQEALDNFEQEKYTSLIIDLRNNPGGLLDSASKVADKFIDSGPIVSTKSRLTYQNDVYTASSRKTTVKKGIPIIVLINRGSASASEILSGALKDTHLAYLVGERSFGKGSVQQPIPLPNHDGIKITIAKYYTPSDTNIHGIGILPDREVLFPEFSEEEEKIYMELLKSEKISKYVESHPGMTEAQIAAYAKQLVKEYRLEERLLRRLIRLEVGKTKPAELYDLDFDLQLNAALDIIKKENFAKLMKNTKTLKQLQEEAEAKVAAEKK